MQREKFTGLARHSHRTEPEFALEFLEQHCSVPPQLLFTSCWLEGHGVGKERETVTRTLFVLCVYIVAVDSFAPGSLRGLLVAILKAPGNFL